MKNKLFYRNNVNSIFSSVLASLLISIMISTAISVSYTNASTLNATMNMNMNMNMNMKMNTSIINANLTNTLHHIDQAEAALKKGDTEGAQKHMDLARQNFVTGICSLWSGLNQGLLTGPGDANSTYLLNTQSK